MSRTTKRQNNDKLPTVAKRKRNISESFEESDDDTEMVDDTHRLNINSPVNRSGKINKIILKNFMSHSKLIIEFNKNVNLLIGNNGSGKSAVLTALIVGLGTKSSATNIAQLIKRGETSGSVNIHIANNCDQGYDRETYGNEIIVQRRFTSDGSSTYLIKNSSGQVISSSPKDLMKILLFMNIQVDNSVCVLNQDASRAFLKESDPKKRFKFFLKATQIDTVIENLNDCNSHYASATNQLEYEKNVLVSLKQEVDKTKTKFESLQSIGFWKKALSNYKLELAWLKVKEEETLQEEIKVTLNKYQQTYDDLMTKMNDRQQGVQARKARCELLIARINELKEEMKVDLGLKDHMRKKISKVEEARNESNRQLLKIYKILQNNRKNIRQLENDMSESKQPELDDLGRSRFGLEEERSSFEDHLDEIDALIQVKRDEMTIIEENIQEKTDMIDENEIEIYNENDFIAEETANFSANQQESVKLRVQLEKLQQQEQECVRKLTNVTQSASNLADRIPIQNSENFLMSKIKETEKVIKTVADSKDSLEEVEEMLQSKATEYSEKEELVENLEKTLLKLEASRQNRYQWLLKFKSHVSLRVQHEFNKIMKLRNYDGTITIDHEKELLELSVIPRDQHISSTNCLSVGERSFSTVAFLLALWSVVDSPFYFLDEHDVYTDAINRYYMTTLLLKEARKKPHSQFIFLTPQDMSNYTASDDLTIQKLANPV